MNTTLTHTRAAVLSFGGWGLQSMLHLSPRMAAVQDRRKALGIAGADLTKVTNFVTLLPEPLLDHNDQSLFYMRRMRASDAPGGNIDPYHVERLLDKIDTQSGNGIERPTIGLLTDAERRAKALMRLAEPVLEAIEHTPDAIGHGFRAPATGVTPRAYRLNQPTHDLRHATRADLFHTALEHAEHVARLLETHLIDPIREDSLAPDDPYVQTTLYVMAPLYEPLASALVWPVVAQLMQRLGRRNITQVVGVFATGSYANDISRAVENATSYAALAELEILTGQRRNERGAAELTALLKGAGSALADQVGEAIFDNIYLLDREKSNQGLAQDSHELAVLAGNALEALIVANGDLFVQEQVGLGLHGIDYHTGNKHPYSLIGAATDYVPVSEILRAVNRQEGRRLAHQWALRATQQETANPDLPAETVERNTNPSATLANLGLTEAQALLLFTARAPEMFRNAEPQRLEELVISSDFVLSASAAADLRRHPPAQWPDAFGEHLAEIENVFRMAAGRAAIDQVWGLDDAAQKNAGKENAPGGGLLSTVLYRVQARLLDMLALSPAGLPRARRQIANWLAEIEQDREERWVRAQTIATTESQELAQARQKLVINDWQKRYATAVARIPTWWQLLLGIFGVMALVALTAYGYLQIVQRAWDPIADTNALLGVGIFVWVVAAYYYRHRVGQMRKLRRERVHLAQRLLTTRLQAEVNLGVVRFYDRLTDRLRRLSAMLAEAEEELSRWHEDEDDFGAAAFAAGVSPVQEIAPAAYTTYLRQPKVSRKLWERCCDFLRQQRAAYSDEDAERLAGLWSTPEWRAELKRLLAGLPLDRSQPDSARSGPQARTIADLIRQTVRQTMMPVDIEAESPARSELVRALAKEFSIEHLLWRGRTQAQEMNRYLQELNIELEDETPEQIYGANIVYSEIRSKHQYAETAWSRAKPTANYDVVDRLATRGSTVDFAAASGHADSDLTRTLLDEFSVALLPTEDPFGITFVRTVHGLGLDDLDCVQRYRTELRYLSSEERALILLMSDPVDQIYRTQGADPRSFVAAFEPE
ncbi:MAG: hypothetical protein R3A44_35540 [Caldilineaceae bacterium]